jgi:MFS family permease
LWVFLPWLFKPAVEVNALIIINALMAIPLTALGVGFNALFAAAVPADWRAQVAGVRNVVLSIVFMLSSLGSGYLLEYLPFPLGYQIIFAIGFFGAAMSSLHLYFIKPLSSDSQPNQTPPQPVTATQTESPRRAWHANLRLDIWKTPFSKVLLVFLAFHLTQYLPIPIFPLFNVNILRLTDEQIGIGTALFYLTVFLGSTQLHRVVHRLGHKGVTSIGVLGLSLYPLLMSVSSTVWHFYGVSLIGGISWSLAGGASGNYLIENIPENDRPAHLAWYTMVLNGCILIGSLIGPVIADQLSLPTALFIFGILRALAGLAILKFG